MIDKVIIDSNVWLYAFMKGDDSRVSGANHIIKNSQSIIVSTQIVNEVCNVLLRKNKISNSEISIYIDFFYDNYPVVLVDEESIRLASKLRIQYTFSFWDSLIVATAINMDCSVLYSEDMQNGMKTLGTQIINPFIH